MRIRTTAADRDHTVAVVRFDDLAVAAEQQDPIGVGDDEHRLEAAQVLVGAPLLAEADGGADQVALVLVEVLLELVEQGQRIGDGPGESADHLAVEQPPNLGGSRLHHDVADGHLAIAGNRNCSAALHRHDGRRVRAGHTSATLGGRYLQAGYPEQLTKGPYRPLRVTSGLPHSGHSSPVGSGAGPATRAPGAPGWMYLQSG